MGITRSHNIVALLLALLPSTCKGITISILLWKGARRRATGRGVIKPWNYECKISVAHNCIRSSGRKIQELYSLFSSPDIMGLIKIWRMRCTGHVTHIEDMRNAYKILKRKRGNREHIRARRSLKNNILEVR
jgi:hypothetical protein